MVFFLLIFMPASSALGVEGVIFEAEAAPGQHVDHEMTVSLRENEAPLDLQVDIQDWGQTLDGSNQELEEGAKSSCSARGFLQASPSSFHLEPGGSQKVLVEGDVPENVGSGGRYALISVHSLPTVEEDEESEGNVGVAVAINALVRLTIPGTERLREGEITDMKIEDPTSCEHQNISLIFKNTGNYHYKACAKAALKDEEGNLLVNSSSPLSSNMIPSASRIFFVSLRPEKELLPGTYRISATVEQEGGSVLASKDTEIKVRD
ncbi:MAG TPA: hypothetical protein VLB04_04230 [Methanotrichaceae archaeon]|nr:hypothetical protein [Methanotrichaceae archaeon]